MILDLIKKKGIVRSLPILIMNRETNNPTLDKALAGNGLRMTRQRQVVYDTLMRHQDHPTAEEVFRRVKDEMANISLATVYNCLEAMVECGLIRQVNRDRESTRFCANLSEHAHFHCGVCGRVHDVELPREMLAKLAPPRAEGFAVETCDLTFRGTCPQCGKKSSSPS